MNIWCFGDSWTWGAELWDYTIASEFEAKKKWGEDFSVRCPENHNYVKMNRWSNLLDGSVSNFSEPGLSNDQIVELIMHNIKTLSIPDIIIIAWSTQYRWTERRIDWNLDMQPHMRFEAQPFPSSLTDNFVRDLFHKQLLAVHYVCKKIPIININAFYPNKTNLPIDDDIYFCKKTMLNIATLGKYSDITQDDWHLDYVKNNNNKYPRHKNLKSSGHPDETGHKLIAKYIQKEIYAKL